LGSRESMGINRHDICYTKIYCVSPNALPTSAELYRLT
jgi:hypothetical protein